MVWTVPTETRLVELECKAPVKGGPVKGALLNEDESRLLSWNESDDSCWWDLRTGQLLATFSGHPVMDRNGTRLLTWSGNVVKMLHATTGETLVELKHDKEVLGAQLSPDVNRILSWTGKIASYPDDWESLLSVWDARTGSRLCQCDINGDIHGAVFSPDGKHVLTWGQPSIKTTDPGSEGFLQLWDTTTGQLLSEFDSGAVDGAAFNLDASRVWSWGHQFDEMRTSRDLSWATLWDAKTGGRLLTTHHDIGVYGPMFNRDRSRIVSWRWGLKGNWSDHFRLMDAETGDTLVEFEGGGRVLGATFDADESHLLSWNSDMARVWDARNGNVIFEHKIPGASFGAKFNRDGSRIICWSSNATWLWDAKTGEELVAFEHGGQVLGATFSQDESHILSWDEDGIVRRWNVGTDYIRPRESLLLRLQVRTKTQLDNVGEVKSLPYNEWQERKCQYDQTTSKL